MVMENDYILRGLFALSLGLIIGFQREQKQFTLAGIRTFPILSLIGFFCALFENPWILPAGLVAVTIIVARGMGTREEIKASGVTTEVTAIFVVLMGAGFAALENYEFVIVAGGICALLLHLKQSMHGWVKHLNSKEVQAIMQFILLAFVILPLLPDKSYDQFDVINPRKIWLMVVMINGISLISFSVQKLIGPAAGTIWTGILGGLISSTATTVSLSRRSVGNQEFLFLVPAIIIASSAAFLRIFAEIYLVAPLTFEAVIIPLSILFIFMVLLSAVAYLRSKGNEVRSDENTNPSQLKAALIFGFLFAVILYLSAWTRHNFGEAGLYAVALISGLIDVDAVTLSTSQLVEQKNVTSETGWKLIITAFLSNLGFKSFIVASIAKGKIRNQVLVYFICSLIAGILVLFFN